MQEKVENGQRVQYFTIAVQKKGQWRTIAESTTIGFRKIVTFPVVKAKKIRVTVTAANATPLIGEIGVF